MERTAWLKGVALAVLTVAFIISSLWQPERLAAQAPRIMTIVSAPGDAWVDSFGASGTAVLTYGHTGCTAVDVDSFCTGGVWPRIEGAHWIWKSRLVTSSEATGGIPPVAFAKPFTLPTDAANISGTIRVTADNIYSVYLNGVLIGSNNGFGSVETYSITPVPGMNGLEFRVENSPCFAGCDNPAGLIYRVDLSYSSNRAPTADAGGPYTVVEGNRVMLTPSASDPDGDPRTARWDLDNNGTFETAGRDVWFSAAGRTAPGSQTIVLQVCDSYGACATDPATVTIAAAQCTTTPAGLVSWWRGEGNAQDSADGNHGSFTGSPLYAAGRVGQAFNLTGANYVQVPDSAALRPGQLTIGGWIKPNFAGRPAVSGDLDKIVEKAGSGYAVWITMDPTYNYLQGQGPALLPKGSVVFRLVVSGVTVQAYSSFPVPDDGSFHHVIATYDGARMSIFIDGVLAQSRPASGTLGYSLSAPLFIGQGTGMGPGPRTTIDEVLIFSRALAEPEIHSVYNSGSAGLCSSPQANQPPTASAGGPYSVAEGGSIMLAGSGADPDGDPLTFSWDLDNDGAFETGGQQATFSAAGEDGPASHTVAFKACDGSGACATGTATVTITNAPPTLGAVNNSGPVSEGTPVTVSVAATDPAGAADPLSYAFDCNNDGTYEAGPQATGSAPCTFPDNGTFQVPVRVTDGDGGEATGVTTVTVTNVAPSATFAAPATVAEGSSITLGLTGVTDPSTADTAAGFTYAFDCGTGSYGVFGPSPGASCPTADNGTRTVGAKVRDKDGGERAYTASVSVTNVAPTAGLANNGPLTEGGGATISFSTPSDPSSADTTAGFRYAFDCANGSLAGATYATSGTSAATTCPFKDNGSFPVRARILDKDGGFTEYQTTVTVTNALPAVGAIAAPIDPVRLGGSITAGAPFTDAGVLDTHTASWDWGDGSTSAGVISETNGAGTVTGSHTYAGVGVYTIKLTVTDKDGGVGTALFEFVVVYNPEGGSVRGSGRIDSPTGACTLSQVCAGAVGEAKFGFQSKYTPGATVPSGNTKFDFKAGDLSFHSDSYEWLVVAGARAQFKGVGTIKDVAGSFGFLLTAIDGDLPGGNGTDKFRIKIWRVSDSVIVYDNQRGAADSDDPTTALTRGEITIQK